MMECEEGDDGRGAMVMTFIKYAWWPSGTLSPFFWLKVK